MDLSNLQISQGYTTSLAATGLVFSILSITTELIVIATGILVPEVRSNFFFNLGLHITTSDFIFTLGSLYLKDPLYINPYACEILGIAREFGWIASIIWTSMVTWKIYQSVEQNLSDDDLIKRKKAYVIICYSIPLLGSALPGILINSLYGPSNTYCWLSNSRTQYFLILCLMVYLPFAVSLVLCGYWCSKTVRKMKFFMKNRASREFLKLLFYPLVMLVCNSGIVVDGLYKELASQMEPVEFDYYYIITRQAQGMLNGLVFLLNKGVRDEVKRWFRKCGNKNEHSMNVAFIHNIEEIDNRNRDELISKYFDTQQ